MTILDQAKDPLTQLASTTGESVWLTIEHQGKVIYLINECGDRAVTTHAKVGESEHMHCLAAGKAILANFPEEQVHEIFNQHGLPAKTNNTIVNRNRLFDALSTIRKSKYAVNVEEAVEGVSGVASPIIVDNEPIGAVVLSAPTTRLYNQDLAKFVELVISTSDEIELKLAYD